MLDKLFIVTTVNTITRDIIKYSCYDKNKSAAKLNVVNQILSKLETNTRLKQVLYKGNELSVLTDADVHHNIQIVDVQEVRNGNNNN